MRQLDGQLEHILYWPGTLNTFSTFSTFLFVPFLGIVLCGYRLIIGS